MARKVFKYRNLKHRTTPRMYRTSDEYLPKKPQSTNDPEIADWLPKTMPKHIWSSYRDSRKMYLCKGNRILAKNTFKSMNPNITDLEYSALYCAALIKVLDMPRWHRKKGNFHEEMQFFTCYNYFW